MENYDKEYFEQYKTVDDVYPLTVCHSRYADGYWAFKKEWRQIPEWFNAGEDPHMYIYFGLKEESRDDYTKRLVAENIVFDDFGEHLIGFGKSPQEAVEDLRQKLFNLSL